MTANKFGKNRVMGDGHKLNDATSIRGQESASGQAAAQLDKADTMQKEKGDRQVEKMGDSMQKMAREKLGPVMAPVHATQKNAAAITGPAKDLASTPAKVLGGNASNDSKAPSPLDMKPGMKPK